MVARRSHIACRHPHAIAPNIRSIASISTSVEASPFGRIAVNSPPVSGPPCGMACGPRQGETVGNVVALAGECRRQAAAGGRVDRAGPERDLGNPYAGCAGGYLRNAGVRRLAV